MKIGSGLTASLFVFLATVALRARPAPQTVDIGPAPAGIVLDGRLNDWPADATTFLLGEAADTLSRPGKWSGTRDLSGAIRLAWDADFLYLAADIVDDKPLQAAATGAEPWQGDSLEVFFNATPGKQSPGGFRQLGLVPPLAPDALMVALSPQGGVKGIEGRASTREGGYTFEVRIPWTVVEGFTPADGALLGFQIMLDDRDHKGRKSQLCWYPSALTYAQPLEMNVLHLTTRGAGFLGPRLLAGPPAAMVIDPEKAPLSVLADVPGAAAVRIRLGENRSVQWPLIPSGDDLATAVGEFPVHGLQGPTEFAVEALDPGDTVLAETTFQTDLAGERYVKMRAHLKTIQNRLKAPDLAEADPEALAGLQFWTQRVASLAANEARAESVQAGLLDQMLRELDALSGAIDQLVQGKDPYAGRTGSFVRAYRSPLTGEFRPHALYVPEVAKDGNKLPLIVILHGIFGDDRALFHQLDAVRNLNAIIYQAASYRQFDWSDLSAAETWAGLDQVLATQPVDRNRISLTGLHIGGRGVLQLAMDRPDLFVALAPLLPGIDTRPPYDALRLYPQYYEKAAQGNLIPSPVYKAPPPPEPVTDPMERALMERQSLATRAENILGVPLRMVRGEAQPDAGSERLALLARLRALGEDVPVRHQIGAQHGAHPPELSDPEFYHWLLAPSRTPLPKSYEFVVTNLRNNAAWITRIDRLTSPVKPGRVRVVTSERMPRVQTSGVEALSPLFSALKFDQWEVDGQVLPAVPLRRGEDGRWNQGVPRTGEKRHGLSGPITDFQMDRFLIVYGTGGSEAENATLEKVARKLADRGLGAKFLLKADRELTEEDRREASLVLVGTPQSNLELAKIADRLPISWTDESFRLGQTTVSGPGAGACLISPNPEFADRYVVVLTANDAQGYKVWDERPGVDYVLANGTPDGQRQLVLRGVFDNRWQFDPALSVTPPTPSPK